MLLKMDSFILMQIKRSILLHCFWLTVMWRKTWHNRAQLDVRVDVFIMDVCVCDLCVLVIVQLF